MKKLLRFSAGGMVVSVTLCALGLWVTEAKAQGKPAAKKTAVFKKAAEMKWADLPDAKGAQQARLWGDPTKGPHGVLDKFAAGTEIPLHSHTADLRTVVLSGTMVIGVEGQSPKELGPGSYFFLPGGLKHTTSCNAGADCVIFSQGSGAFDVIAAETSGANK